MDSPHVAALLPSGGAVSAFGRPGDIDVAAPVLRSPLHALDLPTLAERSIASTDNAIAELPNLGVLVLRGRADDPAFVQGATQVLGLSPATPARRATPCRAGVLLWSSPDEWTLVCRRASRVALLADFAAALQGVHAQCVDNSGGYGLLRLAGPDHPTLLRHLTPYDVGSMALGTCANTFFSNALVTLVRSDPAGMQLLVRRSLADHAWRLLQHAGRPYRLKVALPASVADSVFTPLLD